MTQQTAFAQCVLARQEALERELSLAIGTLSQAREEARRIEMRVQKLQAQVESLNKYLEWDDVEMRDVAS